VKPLLVLVGGTTGTGKSTVATEVARRLGITRLASTDVVRQTMRAFFAPEVLPAIHVSSFEGEPLLETFVEQTEAVLAGVGATLARSVEEGWSTVVEGIHLVPGMVDAPRNDATVVECVLSIEDATLHAGHFALRASGGLRPVERYLAHLDDIRRVQEFIVGRARDEDVPVVENTNLGETVEAVLELVRRASAPRERV
jgi:2-phosphoglycerate kinase